MNVDLLPTRPRQRPSLGWIPIVGVSGAAIALLAHGLVVASADRSANRRGRSDGGWSAIRAVEGRAEFDLAGVGPDSRTLIVVSTLAIGPGPFPITLQAETRDHALLVPSEPMATLGSLAAPPDALAPQDQPTHPAPPIRRSFHLLVSDGDPASAASYRAVEAELRAVGQGVQVYVDREDLSTIDPGILLDVVRVFDRELLPRSEDGLGRARDVDGDGRFTVLFSSWLSRMAGGRLSVDGFVRGADLDSEVSPPFGNRCDMMYLNATLGPGDHLRTVAAHEYAHAVTFSRKVLGDGARRRRGVEEEGWLDEALAHLAEDRHGFGTSNLDYRVSAFLSRPERYRLVVSDYFAEDLFRSHGNRGGTYLFLRWCVDRFGDGLVPRLVGSRDRGIANLEGSTGTDFAELYRRWSLAVFLSGLEVGRRDIDQFRSMNPWDRFGEWSLAGPRAAVVGPDGSPHSWEAEGTASHYVVVRGSESGAVRIRVEGPPEARLQITAVPLPEGMAELALEVRLGRRRDGSFQARALLTERSGVGVRLSALDWEPLVPAAESRSARFRRGSLEGPVLVESFGTGEIGAMGRLASGPIALPGVEPGDGPLIFKAVGTDARGRRIAAWAEVAIPPATDATAAGD